MFNVFTLLLDNALKPATLTNFAINENQLTFDEVKAYKKLCEVLNYPDAIPEGYDSLLDNN